MDLQLKGRRALVTGSSSGIGEGVARMLAQEGCAVVVHGRNRERAEKVAGDIAAAGVAIGDLSNDEGAAAVHEEARAALGGSIEILVNNAGGSSTGNTTKTPIEISIPDFLSNYNANALAAVRLCRLAVPDMVAAHTMRLLVFDPMREEIVEWRSCVMSISSTSSIVSFPSGTAYHSALTLLITRLISQ